MASRLNRIVCTALVVGSAILAPGASAANWSDLIVTSPTLPITPGYLCQGAGDVEIGCPNSAPYLTSGGLLGIGTTNPNAELDVSGTVSATRFVGDGSGLTNITAASSDRITSGTTSMVAVSATGYISLTQAGTNTGWFDPTRGLVTIGVSSTGPISGTAGYFSGSVGVGRQLTYYPLDVSGTDAVARFGSALLLDQYISVRTSTTGIMLGMDRDLDGSGGSGLIQTGTNKGLGFVVSNSVFGTAATPQMFIDGSGSVGIATTAPAATIQVSGTARISSWTMIGGINTPTVPLDVSGAIKVSGDGSESCTSATIGTFRRNPSTGRMQLCYMQ